MALKILVLGAGPGGYAAALHAARRGAQVTLVEREAVGGTCLHWGCIPSKILKTAADRLEDARKASEFGVRLSTEAVVDLAALRHRQQRIIGIQARGIQALLKNAGVRLVAGTGRIQGPGRLTVETGNGNREVLDWDRLILATGSRPASLAGLPFDGKKIVSSNEMLFPDTLPDRLLIVGGGVIGCELASIYRALGSRVTLVEALERLLPLPSLDAEVSKLLLREMKKRGIDCRPATRVAAARSDKAEVRVDLTDSRGVKSRLEVDKILVCIGRRPNSQDLGLDTVGVDTDAGGWVKVDPHLCTSSPGILAIGDLLGPRHVMLAHVASAEAAVAAENALATDASRRPMDYRAVPSAIFTTPEVAAVGMSEAEALTAGIETAASTVLFRALGKAHVLGDIAGQAKIVFEAATGKILGVHLVGPHATELVAEATLAVNQGCRVADLAATIHAHPTLAEIMGEAALKAAGAAIHG
ncbi:MAG TPA: dihydrolipoyl dehydrogenase [Desulfobacteraceae bacterium]|nr:dihydrolipoyl dehydrogenase [Deltaproteobacteria bacterium]RLB97634.1 MAG: dihydrolipoyl dehydrogenase [Deltaproteobacteria bacterium]HDI60179.1 dihydrolipoyl dehydrogenase [Desulfobacteraceae bacterium]